MTSLTPPSPTPDESPWAGTRHTRGHRAPRPARKLNALTLEMLDELFDCLRTVHDSDARVMVLRGAGDKAFCVGADINRFAPLTAVQMWRDWTATGHRVFDALAGLRQPTIAVLHGAAFGGGFELALACDFRVVATDARLGLPEVGLGTVPGWGGTERLTELVGRARAKEVVLSPADPRRRAGAHLGGGEQSPRRGLELDSAVDELVTRSSGVLRSPCSSPNRSSTRRPRARRVGFSRPLPAG